MRLDLDLFSTLKLKLNIPKVDLVGLSMGAANSISFTATYPEMVNSLVLVDFAPTVNSSGREKIAGKAKNILEWYSLASFYLKWNSFDEAVDAIWKANPKRTRENIASRVIHSLEEV